MSTPAPTATAKYWSSPTNIAALVAYVIAVAASVYPPVRDAAKYTPAVSILAAALVTLGVFAHHVGLKKIEAAAVKDVTSNPVELATEMASVVQPLETFVSVDHTISSDGTTHTTISTHGTSAEVAAAVADIVGKITATPPVATAPVAVPPVAA